MALAQLTYRESLRDIEVCLRAHESKLYHPGIRGHVARSNLADANEKRDWRIYRDFANALISEARHLYAEDSFAADLANTVYALDTTTINKIISAGLRRFIAPETLLGGFEDSLAHCVCSGRISSSTTTASLRPSVASRAGREMSPSFFEPHSVLDVWPSARPVIWSRCRLLMPS